MEHVNRAGASLNWKQSTVITKDSFYCLISAVECASVGAQARDTLGKKHSSETLDHTEGR